LGSENWQVEKRAKVWNQLTESALSDVKNRAFILAEMMKSQGEYKKAVSLLEKSLKAAPEKTEDDWYFDRENVERELFDAYIGDGDWKNAEKMFFGGFRYRGNELGKIAAVAAKNGNINDAVRLWKTNANLDRRNLDGLEELAGNAAKPMLREFYLQMKKRDALTDLADKALKSLQ
jgi:tetratricopeptide (TPR) repeat protein